MGLDGADRTKVLPICVFLSLVLAGCITTPQNSGLQANVAVSVTGTSDADCDGKFQRISVHITADTVGGDFLSSSDPYIVVKYQNDGGGYTKLTKVKEIDSRFYERNLTFTGNQFGGSSSSFQGKTHLRVEVHDDDLLFDERLASGRSASFGVEPSSNDESTIETKMTYSPHPPHPGEVVTFEAAVDASCDISAYRWDLDGDGKFEQNGQTVQHVFDGDGQHEVTLTVVNSKGASATTSQEVLVLLDPDGDGITSAREKRLGTDPQDFDSDDDFVDDELDPAPTSFVIPTGLLHGMVVVVLYWLLFVSRNRVD